jgi:hypothetical protein
MGKFEYNVHDLIEINEAFNNAASVLFHNLNKHVYLEIIDNEGDKRCFTLTKRDFKAIQTDFFINVLNDIILDGLDDDLIMSVKLNPNVESFPVEIVFTYQNHIHERYLCNFKELGFIYNALKKQKASIN